MQQLEISKLGLSLHVKTGYDCHPLHYRNTDSSRKLMIEISGVSFIVKYEISPANTNFMMNTYEIPN